MKCLYLLIADSGLPARIRNINQLILKFVISVSYTHLDVYKRQIHGVKYGLVDYLYERMVNVDPKDHKIKISDIFVPIHFDEALDGNIYVFPATKELSYEYI